MNNNFIVIDDNHFIRVAIEATIRRAVPDARITTCQSGHEAIKALDESTYTLGIVDLLMDDGDGLDVIRALTPQKLPAILIVSNARPEIIRGAAALATARGIQVLSTSDKPLSQETLSRALQKLAGKPATSSALPGKRVAALPLDINQALRSGQIVPYFQPQVELETGRLHGFEILSRWGHPEAGVLPPSSFLQQVMDEGLMGRLTLDIWRAALESLKNWGALDDMPGLSLNLSSATLADKELLQALVQSGKAAGLRDDQFTFELTESEQTTDQQELLEAMLRLSMNGTRISLDDVGSGYSSLMRFSAIPFDEVKLDKDLTRDVDSDPKKQRVVLSILELAHACGAKVVAEGIENREQERFLREAGVDIGQGYLYAKPLSAEAASAWLKRRAGDAGEIADSHIVHDNIA